MVLGQQAQVPQAQARQAPPMRLPWRVRSTPQPNPLPMLAQRAPQAMLAQWAPQAMLAQRVQVRRALRRILIPCRFCQIPIRTLIPCHSCLMVPGQQAQVPQAQARRARPTRRPWRAMRAQATQARALALGIPTCRTCRCRSHRTCFPSIQIPWTPCRSCQMARAQERALDQQARRAQPTRRPWQVGPTPQPSPLPMQALPMRALPMRALPMRALPMRARATPARARVLAPTRRPILH